MKYLPRVFRYLRPHWRLATVSAAVIIIGSAANLLAPWPLKILVDNVLGKHPLPHTLTWLGEDRTQLMYFAVIGGLLVTLLINGINVLSNYIHTRLEQYMILDFRSELFQHAQRLSLAFHDQRKSGKLIFAINNQASAPAELVMTAPPMAESLLTLIGMFWVSYKIDAKLALLSLAVVPFLYYSVGFYVKHVQNRIRSVLGMEGSTLSIVHEAISMIRVIVAFGREDYEHRRFRDASKRAMDARVKITLRQTLFSLAVNMITATGTALVLGVGAYHALHGKLTVGQLLIIISYIASVYKPLEAMSHTIGSLQQRFMSLEVAMNLLDTVPDIKDAPNAAPVGRVRGDVVFEHVNFAYAQRKDTLQDINFHARAGQAIAVVGPTGAGKTSLVSLLPRFYQAQSGRILLDGRDIQTITLQSLREQISIVLQEPLLFSGTIAENIRYGRLDASEAQVMEAARSANAHDFIMALPDKYDTVLGERGAAVSIGERQRISVARAFLKDAPILILDEPTSSIDSKTEAVIIDALERLMAGRTTFIIAHRLSTVRNADLILVMNRGRIVEQGTQEQLLKLGGLYKQLHDSQVLTKKPAPVA